MDTDETSSIAALALDDDPVALRVVAAVAAAAASESDPHRLILAVTAPLAALVPAPLASFGLLVGDEVVYPNPLGEIVRDRRAEYYALADTAGQVSGPGSQLPRVISLAQMDVKAFALTTSRAAGRTVGYFFVASLEPGFVFRERELSVLRVVAQVVGPAVQSAWGREGERREAEEQRAVAAVAAAAAGGGGPEQIVEALRVALQPLIEEPFVAYAHRRGQSYAWYVPGGSSWPRTLDQWVAGRVGAPLHAEALAILAANGVHRFTLTPVTAEGVPAGFLLSGSQSERYEFSDRHRSILGVVAQIVGPAVANALANQRLQEEAEEQRLVGIVAASAAREADGSRILETVRSTLAAFVPDPSVTYAYVERDVAVDLGTDADGSARPLSLHERQALAAGQREDDAISAGRCEDSVPGRTVTVATHAGGHAQGLLSVTCRDPRFEFDDRCRRVIRVVAEIVGPALANARAAAATARERALYGLILESLDEAVILFDENLDPTYVNRRSQELFGEVAPLWETMSRDRRLSVLPGRPRDELLTAIGRGVSRSGRTRFPLKDDVWIDYEFLPLDHPEYRLIAVAEDVSAEVAGDRERRRQQEQMHQAARLASLGELVGGVAHELNNPLTAILGFSESLLAVSAGEQLEGDLRVIHKEALRARDIVRDLLFVVRPGPVERNRVDLADVTSHVERLRRVSWDRAGITATVDAGSGKVAVLGNQHQLAQVLLNLVTNAEQALEGREDRRLAVQVRTDREGTAIIEVGDSGSGINDAVRDRIFEPFFTTKQGRGTGLGLSLCRSIVHAHGGTIDVGSRPGGGSLFRVELPLAPAETDAAVADLSARPASRVRVLVVDDEPSIRTIAERLVHSIGHDCESAADVATAVGAARAREFDLYICDYRLGNETVEAFIADLAVRTPDAIDRAVLTTGATTDEGVLALAHAHGLEILPKPFGRADLEGLIARLAA